MSMQGTTKIGRTQGERVAGSTTLEWLARVGLAARGVVYGVIAVLALKLALGEGGKAADQQGALKTIAEQSFGMALLIVVTIGLFGYALWRLLRAAIGHGAEGERDDAKERIEGVASGLGYAILFVTALGILLGSGGSSGGGPDQAAGGVLDWPLGRYLVIAAGLVLIGVAIDQARKGITKQFLEKSHTERMSGKTRKAFTAVAMFGHLARMVIFGLMGYFLVRAAIDYDPDEAVGLDGALAKLGESSFGPIVLGAVAVGLLGFALYSALDVRYRRV